MIAVAAIFPSLPMVVVWLNDHLDSKHARSAVVMGAGI
jgi:hypothetical protein